LGLRLEGHGGDHTSSTAKMRACCIGRRGHDGDDRSCEGAFFGSLIPNAPGDTDASKEDCIDEGDDEAQERRSSQTIQRHVAALGNEPNLLVYMVTNPPDEDSKRRSRTGAPSASNRKQRAHHIPPNTLEGVPIETENFVGSVIVMYKPEGGMHKGGGAVDHPYYRYFSKRKRNWEFRVQGRFKRIPKGLLYIGVVLRDFNYDQAVAHHSVLVKKAGMALVKYDMYMTWGDRCSEAKKPNAEFCHLVTNGLTAWDQIIVTPVGKVAPSLRSELSGVRDLFGVNLERKEMGLAEYSKAAEEVYRNISLENTYTLCFWGVSPVIDLLCWNFRFGATFSMERFFQDDPLHVAMYELEPATEGTDEKQHLEARKRYYLDFMFWSTTVHCPRLASRYAFLDAPEDLERFSAMHCSSNGTFAANSNGSFATNGHVSERPEGRSWLAAWTSKLRWIPAHTCSADKSSQK